ncbi:MAG TPA: polysaccharide biosynthesis/export family protein [Vicinamibacterales bacterium]|nr:polysaccharide biosynthesis/export family protein [Vicinamibacterales bacterium]
MTAFLLALALFIQPAATQTLPAGPRARVATDYVVGPLDVLSITVFGEPDLSRRYSVDTDGTFDFPMIGRTRAGGLTLREIEDALVKRLGAGYLVKPQVSVEIAEYRSKSVFIHGEVRSPGAYPVKGNMSLIEALALAGPTSSASSEVVIVHPDPKRTQGGPLLPDTAGSVSVRVNIKDLQSGKTSGNVLLQDGDTIFVPKAETFFVTGQVRSPGSYVYEPGITVLQAIALAGGLTERGSRRGIKVLRLVNGRQVEVGVGESDVIRPGDTIVVRRRFF